MILFPRGLEVSCCFLLSCFQLSIILDRMKITLFPVDLHVYVSCMLK